MELTLDTFLSSDKYYRFSFLVGNFKSHRFKPSHYGVKFTKDEIVKRGPGQLLSKPDVFFSFTDDYSLELVHAILSFDEPIKYLYFGIFEEDSIRVPKKFPILSPKPSYSDTALFVQMAKPTRIIIDNILIEELDLINNNLGQIHFKINEDIVVKDSDFQLVFNLVKTLQQHSESYLFIEGSTDKSGSFAYNTDLSRRRAESIKKILVDNGIDADRIVTLGKGPNQIGNTKKDASEARKVSFSLYN